MLRSTFLSTAGWGKKPSAGVHILNGHFVHSTTPDAAVAERCLEALSRQARFIRIEEAVRLIVSRTVVDEPLLAFTFDDGFEECLTVIAPVLEKYGTNAAFFVNPHFVEGDEEYIRCFTEKVVRTPGKHPMRWEDLRQLQQRGHVIGAHTLDHYLTASEDTAELQHQIVDCRRVMETHLGQPCTYFAWPFGRLEQTNEQAVALACSCYDFVFSQSDYRHYFSFDGRVINRRHFELCWPESHILYFLSRKKNY